MTLPPQALQRIAQRATTRWDQHYVPSKLRTDPVYAAVSAVLLAQDRTDHPVLDIGCGLGLLGQYLREVGYAAPIAGTDYDERKIRGAQKMTTGLSDMTFTVNDARQGLPPHHGHVVILDILQFFTQEEQALLLKAAADRVAPGAQLIIRSGLRDDSWRYRITVMGDYLAKLTFWMKAAPVTYPTAEFFQSTLTAAGLGVAIQPLWGRTPFNNYLICGHRKQKP
jgi:2-polyprenyl-3-methyl-5-hydroxy-6-metoxy-1,4-benzoquinol methylase